MASEGIYIRQYRPSDLPQIRALIWEAYITSDDSVTRIGRRTIRLNRTSLIAYVLGGVGLVLLSLPGGWYTSAVIIGALLSLAGVALFSEVQYTFTQVEVGFCKDALKTDIQDIAGYYGPPAAFFVAARPGHTEKPGSGFEDAEEVVGYVAFDYQPHKSPEKAELRRMIVSKSHRKHGVGGRLVRALLAHAETIPALQYIDLSTTQFHLAAQRMYERLGWELGSVHVMGGWLWKMEIRHFRKPIQEEAASLKVLVQ
ncbi:acyl-CoA N-acyltransferase [Mycena maculata]|uniref:Acyl-CoA N-acyltransferase n=1 Tax=Mycena maculata TaxID=230809 RepID=A0AAD7K2I7_9AGAR|nr:acyl-CoA N-acyltransferase [Mycena maculata]